jgi:hypothetical protein
MDKPVDFPYIITLVTGDWSGDGHCMDDRNMYRSNFPLKAILEAYQKGVEIIGVDITQYCDEYEDNRIDRPVANSILEKGLIDEFSYDSHDGWGLDDEYVHIVLSEYLKIWIATVKLGNPDIVLEEIKEDGSIDIGGYGLYSV